MKIALSVNSLWNVINFRLALIQALQNEGHELIIFAPHDETAESGKYKDRLVQLGCEVVNIPMVGDGKNCLSEFQTLLGYFKAFKRHRPDIYLGFTIKPNIYGSLAAKWFGVYVVNNIAGLGICFSSATWRSWPFSLLIRSMYRFALKRSDVVFFQNQDDQSMFLRLGIVTRAQSLRLPGSGVPLQHFVQTPVRLYGAAQRPFVFVLVARMLWDKGVAEFVEAARLLKKAGFSVSCRLAGFVDVASPNAVRSDDIRAWLQEGVIEYLGPKDDVRPVFEEADCVVLPSYYREGVPRCLLEAAAMGRPIITTDWVGCREVVKDGLNGFLVEPRSTESLLHAMKSMMELGDIKRQGMGDAGHAHVAANFDEKIVVHQYLRVIARFSYQRSISPISVFEPMS